MSGGVAFALDQGSADRPHPKAVEAQALTQALVALAARHRGLGADDGAGLLGRLTELAAERRQLLGALIATAPGEVLRTALPGAISAAMPAEVHGFLEQRQEVEGELQVLHVDYPDSSQDRFIYLLETQLGKHFSLHFAEGPPSLSSGTAVRVIGLLFEGVEAEADSGTDGAFALETGDSGVALLAEGDAEASTAAAPESPYAFGEQSTLVILVNFQDKPNEQPWTPSAAQNTVFGETNNFFVENSYGQTSLGGDVVGWYTIPFDSNVCDYWTIASLANDAAAAAGVDVAGYNRFVYAFPRNGCSWAGLGTVGGPTTWAWLNGYMTVRLAGHELGHSLGLGHSKGLECGLDVIEGSCIARGYGDSLDIMGSPNAGHINAFQKKRLGWLGYGVSPAVTTVATNGTYTLEPYEPDGTGPKALKIHRSTDPVTGKATWYYVEHRQALGFDGFLAGNDNVLNGVVIHRGTEGDHASSFLLDMTPDSDPAADFDDAALTTGESFADPDAGVIITTVWVDGSGAMVNVSVAPQACVPANPTISFSPTGSQFAEAGTPVTFDVTATNHDDPGCSAAAFDLTAVAPSGWTAVFANPTLTLVPGTSATTTLDVISPVSEANGFYDTEVTATNAVNPAYTVTSTATYVVSNPVNQPPAAGDDSASTDQDTAVAIPVLANDSDPDGDPLTVTAIVENGTGSCQDNGDGTLTYTPDPGFSGTDVFTYSISDGNGGSDNANVTVIVNAVNQPPVAVDDAATTGGTTAVTISVLANDSDPDGDPLSVVAATQSGNGSVTFTGASVTYTPNAGFAGTDGFGYTVSDDQGGTTGGNITVTVIASNQAPQAVDDAAETGTGTTVTIEVLANDWDPEDDTLVVAGAGQAGKGSVTVNADGTITYAPNRKFKGQDSFDYTILDNAGNAASATVLVQVANAKSGGGGSDGGGGGGGGGKGKGKP